MTKTRPIRALETKGAEFELLEQSREEHTAQGVAALLDVDVAQVLKAMLVRYTHAVRPRPGGSFALFITPGDRRLSIKKAGVSLGDKNVELASERDVERITGFRVGSVSVLGLRRDDIPVFIDNQALAIEQVIISAGRPDLGIRLTPTELVDALESAQIGDYCV